MLITEIKREECCGCTACAQVCARKAITMAQDKEGFVYPELDNTLCVNCGLCKSVCPVSESNKQKNRNKTDFVHLFIHSNEEIFKDSSSGGAFTAIAQTFCDTNYAIFGVESKSRSVAVHSYTEDISQINKFRHSKYIQSDTTGVYKQVKQLLEANKKVLFSGTACQVSALKLYLKKDYSNLLCVDVACHGVGNSYLLEKYLTECEKQWGKKIDSYVFRAKGKRLGSYSSSFSKFKFSDGSEKYIERDILFKGFVRNLFTRTSCQSCKFSGIERVSDFSIADFWGIERLDNTIKAGKGTSLILANTPKAQEILSKLKELGLLKQFKAEGNLSRIVPLSSGNKPNPIRAEFMESLEKIGMLNSLNKYIPKAKFHSRVISFILRWFPNKLRIFLRKKLERFL